MVIIIYLFSVHRPPDQGSSGRIQAEALSCWTCGEPTSRSIALEAVEVFHLHPSSALHLPPLDLNKPPGCPGIPMAAPAGEYRRSVFVHVFFFFFAAESYHIHFEQSVPFINPGKLLSTYYLRLICMVSASFLLE